LDDAQPERILREPTHARLAKNPGRMIQSLHIGISAAFALYLTDAH